MAYDIICRDSLGPRTPHQMLPRAFGCPNEDDDPKPDYRNIAIARCQACKTVWRETGSHVTWDHDSYKVYISAPITCPRCGRVIDPKAESTRFEGIKYSKGPQIRQTDKAVSILNSYGTYNAVWKYTRIKKADYDAMSDDDRHWKVFMHKKAYFLKEGTPNVRKNQRMIVLTVSKRGIFFDIKQLQDSYSIDRKKEKPSNVTYNSNNVSLHLAEILTAHLSSPELGHISLTDRRDIALRDPLAHEFFERCSGLLGTPVSSATTLCTAMIYRFRPVLEMLRMRAIDFNTIRTDREMIRNYHENRIEAVDEHGQRVTRGPARPIAPIMKLNRKSGPKQALPAILGQMPSRSIIKQLASVRGATLDWPIIAALIWGIDDPNHLRTLLIEDYISEPARFDSMSDVNRVKQLALIIRAVMAVGGVRQVHELMRRIAQIESTHCPLTIADDTINLAVDWVHHNDNRIATFSLLERITNAYRVYSANHPPSLQQFHDWLVNERNERWRLARHATEQAEALEAQRPFVFTDEVLKLCTTHDGYKFILPNAPADLNDWGLVMHNCIGGYKYKLNRGICLLFAVLNEAGKMVANIEVVPSNYTQSISTAKALRTEQVKGPCNRTLLLSESQDKELDNAIRAWLQTHEIAEAYQ